ncbi:MAG: transposase [Desulfobacteraceae bacterium]|nr:MAG: transposase [Desulfobacteraceae bacterium]
MSRPLRIEYPDAWYHVMNRGRSGESIFLEKADYIAFIGLLKETVDMWKVRVGAYCLMPDHYHLLVQTPDANLSRSMRHLNGLYTQRFNRSHQRDGQLFRGRYKCILVDADSYILELLRYIHRNPVEARLIERLDQYPWSTHKAYLSDANKWNWLYKEFVLSLFSNDRRQRRKRYKEFVSNETPGEINRILGGKKLPSVLGSDSFIDWVRSKFFSQRRHEEVPESRQLAPSVERIKQAVCKAYGVDKIDFSVSRRGVSNEPRNVTIYLLRRLRGDKLDQIGEEFNMSKYSSVSSVIQRIKNEIFRNRKLGKRIEQLEDELR